MIKLPSHYSTRSDTQNHKWSFPFGLPGRIRAAHIGYLYLLVVVAILVAARIWIFEAPTSVTPTAASTLTSSQLGITFAYRPGWRVEVPDPGLGGFQPPMISIYPPEDSGLAGNKVEMAYLGFEIGPGEDLAAWNEAYGRALYGDPLPESTIVEMRTITGPDGVERQMLQETTDIFGPTHSILITNGHLVFAMSTYTDDEAMIEAMEELAATVTFAPDAPRTLSELSGEGDTPPGVKPA